MAKAYDQCKNISPRKKMAMGKKIKVGKSGKK